MSKIKIIKLLLITIITINTTNIFAAQNSNYFSLNAGPGWANNLNRKVGTLEFNVDLESEYNISATFGKYIQNWLRIEIELGYIQTNIKTLYSKHLSKFMDVTSGTDCHKRLMINSIFEYKNNTNFLPFAGIGVGISDSKLEMEHVSVLPGSVGSSVFKTDENNDYNFTYQLMTGIIYSINDNWSLDLVYKFLSTPDRSHATSYLKGNVDISGTNIHLVNIGIRYLF
jgi:opacity protein-like surface antigen